MRTTFAPPTATGMILRIRTTTTASAVPYRFLGKDWPESVLLIKRSKQACQKSERRWSLPGFRSQTNIKKPDFLSQVGIETGQFFYPLLNMTFTPLRPNAISSPSCSAWGTFAVKRSPFTQVPLELPRSVTTQTFLSNSMQE